MVFFEMDFDVDILNLVIGDDFLCYVFFEFFFNGGYKVVWYDFVDNGVDLEKVVFFVVVKFF